MAGEWRELTHPVGRVAHPPLPLLQVRTRLAVCPSGTYRGIADCARKVLAQEGWRAFYRGMVPSMLGILPYAGVDITIFELLKERLLDEVGACLSVVPSQQRGLWFRVLVEGGTRAGCFCLSVEEDARLATGSCTRRS